jgi:hypothetical protein
MSGSNPVTPVFPSDQYSTAAFSDDEKTQIRRYCGYPAYGAGPAGFQGWRFFQAYGLMEFRLNNLSAAEYAVVRQYLATLYALELAIPAAGDNLMTDAAAAWQHNKDEVAQRVALYDTWRRRLCGFLGLPPGPHFGAGGNNIAMVV